MCAPCIRLLAPHFSHPRPHHCPPSLPAVGRLLSSFEAREALPQGELPALRPTLDLVFGGRASVEEVYRACEELGGQWGIDTIALMSK